jgi:hypothetical protein
LPPSRHDETPRSVNPKQGIHQQTSRSIFHHCQVHGIGRLVYVRFGGHSGLKSDIALNPKSADTVEKVFSG